MKYIRLFEERLKDFEILTNSDSQMLIEELKKEIVKEDYDLDYIRDLLFYSHFDIDITWVDSLGDEWTTLERACQLGKTEIVKVLLEEGADPNLQAKDGKTALHFASIHDHSQVVQAILEHPKTNPNLKNQYGDTALHYASSRGDSQVVQALLSHPSIDPNLQDWDGSTALIWASIHDHSQVVEEILKHPSINIKLTNNKGQTAWDLAKPKIREEFPELNPDAE